MVGLHHRRLESKRGASRIVSEHLQGHISVKYRFNKGRQLQLKRVGVDVVQLVEAALQTII